MLKRRILLSVALLFTIQANAQICLESGITFTSQSQIDSFPIDHPGCNNIGGDLSISGLDIENLDSLHVLRVIGGELSIANNPLLGSTGGLNQLDTIKNGFQFDGNQLIEDLPFLSLLDTIGGNIVIENSKLTSIQAPNELTSISGDLIIENNDSLLTFSGFTDLASIAGDFIFSNNDKVESIIPLYNLEQVGGNFWITQNDALTIIQGFISLTSIGQDYNVSFNENLEQINAFSEIETIGNNLIIEGNPMMDLVGNFWFLENIGGDLRFIQNNNMVIFDSFYNLLLIEGGLVFQDNESLSEVNGFPLLIDVAGDFSIENNDALQNLNAFSGLISIAGDLNIKNNPSLEGLSGFSQLEFISGSFLFESNHSIQSFSDFATLQQLNGSMRIHDNEQLLDLNGFEELDAIYDSLLIENNLNLASIEGISQTYPYYLSYINIANNPSLSNCSVLSICNAISNGFAELSFENNALACLNENAVSLLCDSLGMSLLFTSQEEIDAFPSMCNPCDSIVGFVQIQGDDITNLDSLSSIVSIEGSIMIGGGVGNPILTSVSGLSSLNAVTESVYVLNNTLLSDLEGIVESENAMELTSLESIGENLKIAHNDALQNLFGLESLESIGGDLIIEDNVNMTSLTGISGLDYQSIQNLYVFDNPELSTCDVLSVCSYISDPTGLTEIYNNNVGCNNEDEVYAMCTVGVDKKLDLNNIIVYPNPAENILHIDVQKGFEEVRIYSLQGQLKLVKNITLIDISSLESGVYIIEIVTEMGTVFNKVVIR